MFQGLRKPVNVTQVTVKAPRRTLNCISPEQISQDSGQMDLTVLSGAATIALVSATIFLLVIRSWTTFTQAAATTRFPQSIMREPAQRFRDEHEKLGREQSVYLVSALVFTVIFCISYLLPPTGIFDDVPAWQLIIVLVVLIIAAGAVLYRLIRIFLERRRLLFVRDANMATGHSLQKLTSHSNRVFHDVSCLDDTIDNVVVGLQGIYAISVIARQPSKDNRVRLKGDQLMFAPGNEAVSVARSGAKSRQLARELRKVTGHDVRIRSVIAIPGWEVELQESADYLVVNERNLAMLTGWKDQNDYLMNEDVAAIQKLLTERCTRFR